MLKRRLFWVVLIVVVLLGASGYYVYTTRIAPSEAAASDEPSLQTAVARLGELEIVASGAGQVIPASEINVGFEESGTLIELNVGVGDKVQAGQVLARLQTNNTPEEIAVSITDAELNVIQAQQNLDDLYTNAVISRNDAMNDIATYAQAVRDAQYQMENYNLPTYLQGLDVIEGVDLMKAQLDAASEAFAPYRYYSPNNATRQELLEALNVAQSQYDAAVKRLNYEYELQVAKTNLENARRDYEKYKDGPAVDELELAQTELANAQAKLDLATKSQAIIELLSPADGTVMAVEASMGEAVSASPIITVADLEQPLLEVYLDETDLDKVALGYEAEVIFDAVPDTIFSGKVISVSPSLETISGVQAVKVHVLLDKDSIDPNLNLPVGLNASVDVIAGRAENAVLVPVEALRELDPGEYAVFVVEDGEPILRLVEVGLMDVTSVEIISGLEAGEIVTTGIVQAE